jgi:heme/copper-type cytochrome/quinol oxidase subunit 3
LSAAEWRILVITAVGGLISLVAAAGIIGGAIALARSQESIGLGTLGLTTGALLIASVSALVGASQTPTNDRRNLWVRRSAIATASFGVAFVLLVWVGVAAGIN